MFVRKKLEWNGMFTDCLICKWQPEYRAGYRAGLNDIVSGTISINVHGRYI